MADFSSYQDINMYPYLVDSAYLKIMSGFTEDVNNMAMNSNCFSQIYPHPILQEANPFLDHQSSEMGLGDDDDDKEHSVTIKQSSESSTVVDKLESGEQVTQKLISPIGKKRKTRYGSGSGSGSSSYSAQSKDARVVKGKNQKQCNGEGKQKPKAEHQEPPSGYVHVRARRGQATDSHSLAERVRRAKISERMKILQRLVPGCDKITGKALMLDKIINYVHSLQNQVELLSMKIASLDPMSFDFSLVEDSLILSPEEKLISMHTSPLPHSSTNQLTVLADTTPSTTYAFSQDNANLLWDVEEQGQKFLNPSGLDDNVCFFN